MEKTDLEHTYYTNIKTRVTSVDILKTQMLEVNMSFGTKHPEKKGNISLFFFLIIIMK